MLAVKDITGKFTPKYAEAIRPFTEWLLQYGYDYNYKNGTFTIKFTADAGFDAVKVAADEIDNQFELQGDLFDNVPEDVTNGQELLEAEFEEVKIPTWLIRVNREAVVEEPVEFFLKRFVKPTLQEMKEAYFAEYGDLDENLDDYIFSAERVPE